MHKVPSPPSAGSLIREHIEAGRLQQAIDDADAALASATERERPMLLSLKSLGLVTTGQALDGLRTATHAHELAATLADPVIEGEALLALGFALQSLEEHTPAIEAITHAERLAKQAGDVGLHARAMRRLGISCSVLGRHEQALKILEQVVIMLATHGTLAEQFHARYSALNAKSRATDSLAADDGECHPRYSALLVEWRAFAEEAAAHKLTRLELMALANAGIAAQRSGELAMALSILERAAAGHARTGLRGHEAVAQNHMAVVLLTMGRKEDAINAFTRGIALLEGGSPRELKEAWEALADAYESIDDPRLALAAYKKAREFERQLHDDDARLAAARREQREEIARLADQWSRLADEDTLTGIANRRAFDRSLAVMLEGARAGRHFSLLCFDLDYFKRINDSLGHAAGDRVLRRFADLLREERRAGDLPARIGGEEFALILPIDSKQHAAEVAERIRHACKIADWCDIDADLSVTVSIGVVVSHEIVPAALGPEAICERADRRLYAAKHEGRDRVNMLA